MDKELLNQKISIATVGVPLYIYVYINAYLYSDYVNIVIQIHD